jgi:hypothetical protein
MKYILHVGICGFGNQLLGFKETLIMAQKTGRSIILPHFIPHATIRNRCNKYYHFETIFDKENFKKYFNILDIDYQDQNVLNKILRENVKNIYFMRTKEDFGPSDYYYQLSREIYELNHDYNEIRLNNKFIKSDSDLDEIKNIEDDYLIIIGTFNSIKLSKCAKNGCVYCGYDNRFMEEYNYSTKSLIHSNIIKEISNFYLENAKISDYIGYHIRTPDNAEKSKYTFFKLYNNMHELRIYKSILKYANSKGLNLPLYISIPPDGLKIKNMKIFNSDKVLRLSEFDDLFIYSIVELELLYNSKILIYSPSNTPYKIQPHQRSSFTLHIKELRKVNDLNKNDKNILTIY